MLDLKPFQDAVRMADDEVKRVANDINALFIMGTDEAKNSALALQETLDTAQAKYDAAAKLYESMKKSSQPSDVAQNFVPVSTTSPTPEAEAPKNVMTLAEYNALSPVDRLAFAKRGGKLQD
mgnify:CR=1 FL=1